MDSKLAETALDNRTEREDGVLFDLKSGISIIRLIMGLEKGECVVVKKERIKELEDTLRWALPYVERLRDGAPIRDVLSRTDGEYNHDRQ